jgi:hypothetical protein
MRDAVVKRHDADLSFASMLKVYQKGFDELAEKKFGNDQYVADQKLNQFFAAHTDPVTGRMGSKDPNGNVMPILAEDVKATLLAHETAVANIEIAKSSTMAFSRGVGESIGKFEAMSGIFTKDQVDALDAEESAQAMIQGSADALLGAAGGAGMILLTVH